MLMDYDATIVSIPFEEFVIGPEKWVDKIFNLVERLSEFPESGRVVPEINNKMFREIISGNYRIIYKHEKSKVLILTVRHGKQILPIEEIKA